MSSERRAAAVAVAAGLVVATCVGLVLLWRGGGEIVERHLAAGSPTPAAVTPTAVPSPTRVVVTEATGAGPTLTVAAQRVRPGEPIAARFSGILWPQARDWLALYQVGAPGQSYREWRYLDGKSEGELSFTAPVETGEYECRLMLDWPNGGYTAVARSEPVLVVADGTPVPADVAPSLRLARSVVGPGEQVVVSFTAPASYPSNAWVGILPANVPHGDEALNDQHETTFQYLSGRRSGQLSLVAPTTAGAWDVRLHDTDSGGREVASVGFVVSTAAADLSGRWRGDDGLVYTLRQLADDRLWWRGEDAGGEHRDNVAHGRVASRALTVEWAELSSDGLPPDWRELPPGQRPLLFGTVVLTIESEELLVVTTRPDGCRLGRLERLRPQPAGS